MRLLVVENDPALATFFHNSFNAEHYAVASTQNSEEAEQMVHERSYDLAILDMNLTLSNGMQVLQCFRAKRSSSNCPSWCWPPEIARKSAWQCWI